MVKIILRVSAAAGLALSLSGHPAAAGDCRPSDLASFSRLGEVVAEARAGESGKLLGAWLLQPRDSSKCDYVFRIDLLMQNGRILSMNFDARTLEPVEIRDDRDWVEAGAHGEGGEAASSGAPAADDDDKDDDDKDDDDNDDDDKDDDDKDDDDKDDNSGTGTSGDDSHDSDSDDSDSDSDDSHDNDSDDSHDNDGHDSDSSGSGSGGSGSGGDD